VGELTFLRGGGRNAAGVGVPAVPVPPAAPGHSYLTQSVYPIDLQKSIYAQICQRILYISNNKGSFDESVRALTFAKRFNKNNL